MLRYSLRLTCHQSANLGSCNLINCETVAATTPICIPCFQMFIAGSSNHIQPGSTWWPQRCRPLPGWWPPCAGSGLGLPLPLGCLGLGQPVQGSSSPPATHSHRHCKHMYASHSKHKMLPEAVLLNTNTPKLAPSPPPAPAMRGPGRARHHTVLASHQPVHWAPPP